MTHADSRTASEAGNRPYALAGLRAQAQALVEGHVTAAELVEASLTRMDATRSTLNAFRVVRAESAREEARAADRRLEAGERLPLLGVPVAIKDDTDLAGETTEFGCDGDFEVKHEDSEMARRLRHAGAVIVGKTTSSELGQWPMAEGAAFGATRNPWDTTRTPGGSSGGSAAAVAAGLVPGAIGSDGAGSVRIPAAWTNLVGIKPQRGRISTWPEAESFNGLTCFGPLARTVDDAALLLDAAAGNRPGDIHRPAPPSESYLEAAERAEPGRMRIALSLRIPFSGARARLDEQVRTAVERLGDRLAELGHEVDAADPVYGAIGASFMPRSTEGVREWVSRMSDPSRLDPRTRHNAKTGRLLAGPLLRAARALEPALRAQVGRIFRRFDVVLAPTTALPPMEVGALDGLGNWETDKAIVAACPYTWPWNVLGWPAMNVPAGLTESGLPVGAQLMGPENGEGRLISLAAQLEQTERWEQHRPPLGGALDAEDTLRRGDGRAGRDPSA